jgi:hypothetical protein
MGEPKGTGRLLDKPKFILTVKAKTKSKSKKNQLPTPLSQLSLMN